MPYHYHSSLTQLNFTSSGLYEVSGLWVMSALCVALGGHCWSGPYSHMASPKPWALGPVGQLQALRVVAGAIVCTGILKLRKQNYCV